MSTMTAPSHEHPDAWPTPPASKPRVADGDEAAVESLLGSGLYDRHMADPAAAHLEPVPETIDSTFKWPAARRAAIGMSALSALTMVTGLFLTWWVIRWSISGMAWFALVLLFVLAILLAFAAFSYRTVGEVQVRADATGIRADSRFSHWQIDWSQMASIIVHDAIPGHPFACRTVIVPKPDAQFDHRFAWLIRNTGAPKGSVGAPLESHAAPALRRLAAAHGLDAAPATP